MSAVAYSYIRFSTTDQRKGDSLRRQTEAARNWCNRNDVHLDESLTFRDLGKSAYLGEHRKNPDRSALAGFLKLVQDGRVARGSYLVIESLDRLTREHVRAGLMLLLGLIESGVRIVQLSPSELVYDEKSDEMGLMLAIVELSRGHRESKRKSDMSGPNWQRKKQAARDGKTVTSKVPAWIEVHGDRRDLIPERAATVKLIFKLAANGYGTPAIVAKLNRDGVPPMGDSGKWVRGYVGNILRDRRALGEYQPRKMKKSEPDGAPVKGYFPRVVSDEEFYAVRAAAAQRGKYRGRKGAQQLNLFAGLIKNAREGDAYFMTSRNHGEKYHVLINCNSEHGLSPCHSFPYLPFEEKVLEQLAEVDPSEIIGHDDSGSDTMRLSVELASVDGKIAELEGELLAGDVPSLARALRQLEERRRGLVDQLAEARAKAAHPLAGSWGDAQSLLSVLASAADPEDVRLRLRQALRRIISEAWLLVVRRGITRLAVLQIHFTEGGRRDYLIVHRRAHKGRCGPRKEGYCEARSLAGILGKTDLDLRKPEHVARLETSLQSLDLTALAEAMA